MPERNINQYTRHNKNHYKRAEGKDVEPIIFESYSHRLLAFVLVKYIKNQKLHLFIICN